MALRAYVTFLWNTGFRNYLPEHVDILAAACKHWDPEAQFICITETKKPFSSLVTVVPMPKAAQRVGHIPAPQGDRFPSSYRRLWCFSKEAAEVLPEQIMLLDVDCMMVGDPTPLWAKDEDFVGWRPMSIWGREDRIGGGTWMLRPGTKTHLWEQFIKNPGRIIQETRELGWTGSDQAILSRFLKGCSTWNQQCGIYGSQDGVFEWEMPPKDAIIVHFNGDDKPWNCPKLWMRAYCRYFGGQHAIETRKVEKSDIEEHQGTARGKDLCQNPAQVRESESQPTGSGDSHEESGEVPKGLNRQEKVELIYLLEEKERRQAAKKHLTSYAIFYPWQRDFVAATHQYYECCLCAGNQIGKTFTGTTIDAMHLLGDYPEDWEGHQFDHAPLCWGLSYSMEKSRDLLQKALFGELRAGEFTGGLIPKDRIIDYQSAPGTPNACRTVRVKHRLGVAVMQFWSYTQGQHAIMGDVVDWVHVDEEPEDQTIRPQLLTRTINGDLGRGGRIIYTFTPENGRTELVVQFMDTPTSSQFFMQKGWDDAPHMTDEKKERLLDQYPSYQRDMRSKGDPMLGHGRIYDIGDDYITCDPLADIPDHWYVIRGMDFGWDHPQAHIQLYEDRDNGIFYVAKAWKARHTSANDAWGVVKEWGEAVPTAWPQDGLQHEKARDDAVQQKVHYQKAGFKMLSEFATWPPVSDGPGKMKSGGNSVEQGLYEIADLMRKGNFRFVRGLTDLFDEFRQYHRDEKGKVVKTKDDLLDAVRTAYMMRRYAMRVGDLKTGPTAAYIPKPMKVIG